MNTPGHFLERQTGLMPLSTTIWAPATLVFIATFLVALLVAARFLHPSRPQSLSQFPDTFHSGRQWARGSLCLCADILVLGVLIFTLL